MADEANLLHIEFFIGTKLVKSETKIAGRPIYKDVERVRIRFPGDPKRDLVAPAHAYSVMRAEDGQQLTYAERFPEHYRAYKEDVEYIGSGTPITEAPFLTKSRAKEYQGAMIKTIEMLANINESVLRKMGMSARADMEAAKEYLANAAGSADVTRLAAENAELMARLEALESASPAKEGPSDDDLKALIKERTGSAPRGNPSRETLERMVAETESEAA